MKLNLLPIAFGLSCLSFAYGQTPVGYHLGLTTGINAGQLQQGSVRSYLLWRYNAGVVLEQRFSPAVTITYEVLYARQGSRTPVSGLGGDDELINALDYINLPIMLRYRPKGKRGFLEVGGQGAYLVSGKGYFNSAKNQASSFRHTNQFDAGLTAGLGYRLGNHVVVDARYYHGLNQVLANYTAPAPQTGVPTYYQVVKWYNRVFSLNLSYYL